MDNFQLTIRKNIMTIFFISAERANKTEQANALRTTLLRGYLIELGFEFKEVLDCYREEGQEKPSVEHSFMVYTNNQEEIEKLAKGFDQDAILRMDGSLGSIIDFLNDKTTFIGKARYTKTKPVGCYTQFLDDKDYFLYFE